MPTLDDFRNLAKALCAFLRTPGSPEVFNIPIFLGNVPAEVIDE